MSTYSARSKNDFMAELVKHHDDACDATQRETCQQIRRAEVGKLQLLESGKRGRGAHRCAKVLVRSKDELL